MKGSMSYIYARTLMQGVTASWTHPMTLMAGRLRRFQHCLTTLARMSRDCSAGEECHWAWAPPASRAVCSTPCCGPRSSIILPGCNAATGAVNGSAGRGIHLRLSSRGGEAARRRGRGVVLGCLVALPIGLVFSALLLLDPPTVDCSSRAIAAAIMFSCSPETLLKHVQRRQAFPALPQSSVAGLAEAFPLRGIPQKLGADVVGPEMHGGARRLQHAAPQPI